MHRKVCVLWRQMKRAIETLSDYPPPGMEVRLIERYARIRGSRLLEIGCGDGRLTREVAPFVSSVVAFEPDREKVATAKQVAAVEGLTNVSFRVGAAERLRVGGGPFDIALFSWSL